jgi:hypothetical protein
MSIVLPLKNVKSPQNLTAAPDFASWQPENLVNFCKQANERLKAQEEQIEALKTDLRLAMEAYRKILIETQRQLSDP